MVFVEEREKISGPIFEMDLIGKKFYPCRSTEKGVYVDCWLFDENPELAKHIEYVIARLLRAVPWIESELAGDYLHRKML